MRDVVVLYTPVAAYSTLTNPSEFRPPVIRMPRLSPTAANPDRGAGSEG